MILARTQLKKDIYLVPSLEDSLVRDMMITPAHSIEEGLDKAFKALGKDAKIAAILLLEGCYPSVTSIK